LNVYLDSSAAAKVLLGEPEADAVAHFLRNDDHDIVSSDLLETELRRIAVREGLPQLSVTQFLQPVEIHALPRNLYVEAGILPGLIRTLDALHVVAAIRLGVDSFLTYDRRLAAAAEANGFAIARP